MDLLSNVKADFEVLREPRGFMRVVQLVLAIFAFATITSVKTGTQIRVYCTSASNVTSSHKIEINYSYPFRFKKTADVMLPFCEQEKEVTSGLFTKNYSSSAEFFCFVGVVSFLMQVVLIPAYVFITPVFAKDSLASKLDFLVSVAWTILWFIASTAWADNLNKMAKYVQPENMIEELGDHCQPGMCQPIRSGDNSTLTVSAMFGFLNMGLCGASLWFLFKETEWHKDKEGAGHEDPNNVYSDPGYQTPEYTADPTIPAAGGAQPSFGSHTGGNEDYYGQPTY